MTPLMEAAPENTSPVDPWGGFTPGPWWEMIDVRNPIQCNYIPYAGDAPFLTSSMTKILRIWEILEKEYSSVERVRHVYDVDTETPVGINAFIPGHINEDDDMIVGLQTGTPLKRAMMPNGG